MIPAYLSKLLNDIRGKKEVVENPLPDESYLGDIVVVAVVRPDEVVEWKDGEPEDYIVMPEWVFRRMQAIAGRYNLHLLYRIDVYSQTRLNPVQCQRLQDEIAFLQETIGDPLLENHLARMQSKIRKCIQSPLDLELLLEGP